MQLLALAAALAAATSSLPAGHPAPTPPFDQPAGVTCAFAIHGDPIDDQVQELDLATYPDGSPKRAVFAGRLIIRVTNKDNGKTYDADASGTAIVGFGADGSQHWDWTGPVMVGFRAANSNHAQGLYILDGVYDLKISADHQLTLEGTGHETNVCAQIA